MTALVLAWFWRRADCCPLGARAAILWNEAHGFSKPGRLDWTDAAGVVHRVRGRLP